MAKTQINELAHEFEVKRNVVLEYLARLDRSGKLAISGALDDEVAEKVRQHFRPEVGSEGSGAAIWINELAHELTVKGNVILHYLAESGIAEGKPDAILFDREIANKLREHFRAEVQRKDGGANSKADAK